MPSRSNRDSNSSRSPTAELAERIVQRTARVGIIGLGYVGLPLVELYLSAGFRVIGFDTDPKKIDALSRGESYIGHISDATVAGWLQTGRFRATSNLAELSEPDVILICVPTPLTESREPDLQYVEATARSIAKVLRPGQLVILESTTYPGTTREVVVPLLAESGLVVGQEIFVAFSPEREDPGNADYSAGTIPKVVGGLDAKSLELATAFYSQAIASVVPVSTCEVAEACKLLENIYRSVNIAMINELKMLFARLDIDVWEVIEAAKTKPFGFQAFYPGPGWGGHCIPVDPFYLSWLARRHDFEAQFVELAGKLNTKMPEYVVERVAAALDSQSKAIRGSKIGILGVAYKRDLDDPRESPAFRLMELLSEQDAILSYCDPHVPSLPKMRNFNVPDLRSNELTPAYLKSLDCALIVTEHSAFDWKMIVEHSRLVVDTRNAIQSVAPGAANVWKA